MWRDGYGRTGVEERVYGGTGLAGQVWRDRCEGYSYDELVLKMSFTHLWKQMCRGVLLMV